MDPATALAISGWFIQVLFDKLLSAAIASWRADPDLKRALERLEISMTNVRTVLPLTQNILQVENEGLLDLLKLLKEAFYDADDLLDELDYRRLQQEAEGDDDNGCNKVSNYLSKKFNTAMALVVPCCLTNNTETDGWPLAGCDTATVDRINKIVERLDDITSGVRCTLPLLRLEELGPKQQHGCILNQHRVTTSFLMSEHTVLGRDREMKEIIELLIPDASAANEPKLSVLPVVGVGGVGKTTLARLVYNNEKVKGSFDRKMWVCVSDNFDAVRLTREMLDCFDVRGSDHPTNPNRLQEVLKEKLSCHKFLLVLDDVWNDKNMTEWEKFCAPLGSGKPGSRILMTTRLYTVVQMVGGTMDTMSPIELKGLTQEKYWSLFKNCAFGGEVLHQHNPELEKIGRQIVKKLSGSPLAAKTLGGLLRERIDVNRWRSILECSIWELPHNPNDIMPVLRLSYQHLPPHLQQCFAYCSVFPKDYKFEPDKLVAMWIAQGYVQDKTIGGRKKRLMDIGIEYFHNLQRMSFFEKFNDSQFVIHDLLHDLSESISAGECFRVEGKTLKGIPKTVRHLSAGSDMIRKVLKQSCNLANLRTLIIQENFNHSEISTIKDLYTKLRRLRVVQVGFYLHERFFPLKIDHLIHLRYLEVRNIDEFYHPLSRLYHLQNLKSSHIMDYSSLRIGKITHLQELERFSVVKKEGHDIGQLKNLGEIGGTLKLYDLNNVASKAEALEAQLNKKEHISKLELSWKISSDLELLEGLQPPAYIKKLKIRGDSSDLSPKVAEEVLEGLQPPPYIKKLKIRGYPGVKFPTWITQPALSTLKIIACPRITSLPSTEVLHQPLKRLKIKYCPELMSIKELQAFVSLDTLSIIRCPKLIPAICSGLLQDHAEAFSLRLCKLTIDDPAILSVLLKKQSLSYLKFIKIKFYELTSFNMEEEIFSHLTSLEKLHIIECPNLEFLPAYLKSLPSLKKLTLGACGKLQSLPPMPASLTKLIVINCQALQKERYKKEGQHWLNAAHVPTIIWRESGLRHPKLHKLKIDVVQKGLRVESRKLLQT